MQGKTIKTAQGGTTKGSCGAGTQLTCSDSDTLGDDTCNGKLRVCESDATLHTKQGTKSTLTCCGEGLLIQASLNSCGTGSSLCNLSGETLK
jgi:hypothetical protein